VPPPTSRSADAGPAITLHPVDRSVSSGTQVTFAVTAVGSNLAYQWRRNGTPVSGATASTYAFTAAAGASGSRRSCPISR